MEIAILSIFVANAILTLASCILIFSAVNKYISLHFAYRKLKGDYYSAMTKDIDIKHKISYTNDMLDFIRQFVMDNTVIRYNMYKDGMLMTKVTKSSIENMISQLSTEIKSSLRDVSIEYDSLLCTKEYVDEFIVTICMSTVKELLEKTIDDIADETSYQ